MFVWANSFISFREDSTATSFFSLLFGIFLFKMANQVVVIRRKQNDHTAMPELQARFYIDQSGC